MENEIRWGICGTGRIARKFASDLGRVDGASLTAVYSRVAARADAFGAELGAQKAYDQFDAFASDPTVDVVYVATPQARHYADTVALLQAGKAVLCEKPFALDGREAREMVREARQRRLFLMEAMWMRFLPAHVALQEVLDQGVIGKPQVLSADFGYRIRPGSRHRLLDLSLGGGALLDLGVYPVALASQLFGPPESVTAAAVFGKTGVDEQTGAVLRYRCGALALVHSSIRVCTSCAATISGTEGQIMVCPPFHAATTVTVATSAGMNSIFAPFEGHGLHHEITEVMLCLRSGRTESEKMPLNETVQVMDVLDAIRDSIDLVFRRSRSHE